MNNIFFSIIICCYNSEKYLEDTINSVLNQNFKKWELILVDDGSTDFTKKIIKKYLDNSQNLIRYVLSSPDVSKDIVVQDKPFTVISYKDNYKITKIDEAEKYIKENTKRPNYPLIKNKPILVIDDEVDHASVDTGVGAIDENDEPNEEHDPKTINKLNIDILGIINYNP